MKEGKGTISGNGRMGRASAVLVQHVGGKRPRTIRAEHLAATGTQRDLPSPIRNPARRDYYIKP